MKKIFTLAIAFTLASTSLFGQDKKMKFGLQIAPALNWYQPDNTRELENAGTNFNFAWGGVVEFGLGDNAAFVSGLSVTYDGGKLNYLDTAYYSIADDELLQIESNGMLSNPADTALTASVYKLNTRTFSGNYITVPLAIKAKTNEIGYLTYFGQFGLNLNINTRGRADDDVTEVTTNNGANQADLDIDNELQPFKADLMVGIGAEYNLSGSTSAVFGIHYRNGFMNVLKNDSRHLLNADGSAAFEQKILDRGLVFSLGILF